MVCALLLSLPLLAHALAPAWEKYSASLQEEDKRILARLDSLGAFDAARKEPYARVDKKDGLLALESFALIPGDRGKALPMARDFGAYKDWVLERINERRDKKGRYLLDIESMEHLKDPGLLKVWVRLNVLFKGRYFVRLRIDDLFSDPDLPGLVLSLNKPTKLASMGRGSFKLYAPPESRFFVVYFYGEARPHWAIYHLLPLSVFQSEAVGRIQTILDNILVRLERLGAL